MNDFTIDELVLLAQWSGTRFEKMGIKESNKEGTIALSHKLQAMIINYCDHELCDIDYDHQCLTCRSCKDIVE